MAASGEAGEGFGDIGGAEEFIHRLWTAPFLHRRSEMCCTPDSLRHVEARRVII